MFRFFIFIFIAILCISGRPTPSFNEVTNCFNLAQSVTVYNNGETTTYSKDSNEFNDIISALLSITSNSHQMPAFSVSLDRETRLALKNGLWLELNFNHTYTASELPFSSLLIEVNKQYTGFNIIRKLNGKYDGRCFYLDLVNTNMQPLYDSLI